MFPLPTWLPTELLEKPRVPAATNAHPLRSQAEMARTRVNLSKLRHVLADAMEAAEYLGNIWGTPRKC